MREKTFLEQFPDNIPCVYYGLIDIKTNNYNFGKLNVLEVIGTTDCNTSLFTESRILCGKSNCLRDTVASLKRENINFRLVNAVNTVNIENIIQIEVFAKILQLVVTNNLSSPLGHIIHNDFRAWYELYLS